MNPPRIAGISILAAIALLALMPQPWKGRLATFGTVHDCAHVAAFLIACFLTTWRVPGGRAALCAGLLLLLFGLLLEVLQTRIYGNHFEYRDLVADAAGIATGLLLRNIREERYGR
jgi:hypothetical protein